MTEIREALTAHAAVRMQQRGIPARVVEWVLCFGAVVHDHRGGRIVYLDRRACRRATKAGAVRRPEAARWRGVYAVLGADGRVATVGRRHKRIPRPWAGQMFPTDGLGVRDDPLRRTMCSRSNGWRTPRDLRGER